MHERAWLRFDFLLVLTALVLAFYGVAVIYSASAGVDGPAPFLENPAFRQALYVVAGLAVLLAMTFVDYRVFGIVAPILYGTSILALVTVMAVGTLAHGSRRWISFGGVLLQPSEFTKLVLIIVLAKFLSDNQEKLGRPGTLIKSALLIAPQIALIFLQPDLGTAVLIGMIWLGMVTMAGVRLVHLGLLFGLGGAAVAVAFPLLARGYMLERLQTFLDPESDPLGAGYNVLQSSISVGSGGLLGKGFLAGTQSQLDFLRVKHTDFIFSVLGEELGFVGAMGLFLLFIILLFRGIRIAMIARELYGRLIAIGIVVMILVQAFVNIGVNVRLLPVTGVPLPFISYGGSSLLTIFLALGILESIAVRHKRLEF